MLTPNQIKRQEDLKNAIQELTKRENSLMYQLEVIRDEISDIVREIEQLKEEDRLSTPVTDSSEHDMDIKRQAVEDLETYQAEKIESNYFSQFEDR